MTRLGEILYVRCGCNSCPVLSICFASYVLCSSASPSSAAATTTDTAECGSVVTVVSVECGSVTMPGTGECGSVTIAEAVDVCTVTTNPVDVSLLPLLILWVCLLPLLI